MTSTSPGRASATAAWIIRLSPGRTSTVKAGPASCMRSCTGATRPCMVPRRPATSERMAAWKAAACSTRAAPARGGPLEGPPPPRHVGKNGGREGCGLFDEVGADALEVTNDGGKLVHGVASPVKRKGRGYERVTV